jgi:hypothetical protein
MQVNELFEPTPAGYRTEKDDNSVLKADDTRKTRLTLSRLNKLRMMNDVRRLEHEQKLEKVNKQYQVPATPPAM